MTERWAGQAGWRSSATRSPALPASTPANLDEEFSAPTTLLRRARQISRRSREHPLVAANCCNVASPSATTAAAGGDFTHGGHQFMDRQAGRRCVIDLANTRDQTLRCVHRARHRTGLPAEDAWWNGTDPSPLAESCATMVPTGERVPCSSPRQIQSHTSAVERQNRASCRRAHTSTQVGRLTRLNYCNNMPIRSPCRTLQTSSTRDDYANKDVEDAYQCDLSSLISMLSRLTGYRRLRTRRAGPAGVSAVSRRRYEVRRRVLRNVRFARLKTKTAAPRFAQAFGRVAEAGLTLRNG